MVCESAVKAAVSGASKMPWMDKTGLAEWSTAAASAAEKMDQCLSAAGAADQRPALRPSALSAPQGSDASRPPSAAVKEMLRLRKKLREITKIEERLAAGQNVDPLQRPKLEKKDQLCAQLEQAEQAVAAEEEEEMAAQTEQLQQRVAMPFEAAEGGFQVWGQADGQRDPLEMPPVQMYPLPVSLDRQQQAGGWQGYQEPVRFGSVELQQPQLQDWAEAPAEGGEPNSSWAGGEGMVGAEDERRQDGQSVPVTTSARRRQRRQRAAQRQPEAAEEPEEPSDGELDCAELINALEAGGKERDDALESLRGQVLKLSFAKDGCRVVQKAVQVADHAIAGDLVGELSGHVQEAIGSPHANYVVQALIAGLPTASSSFVVQELSGAAPGAARHRFGCRVICRLVEHAGQSEGLKELLNELLAEAEDLCRHSFAHYVLQSMLEHLPGTRARIAEALRADVGANARHRCASHVVEAALEHCSEEDRRSFEEKLLGPGLDGLVPLAQSQYGSFVLKAILRLPGGQSKEAWNRLAESVDLVDTSKYGQRLLKDLGLRAAPAVAA